MYYKDGESVESSQELCENEYERGIRLHYESYEVGFGESHIYKIWDYMTVDKLQSFEPSSEYGYVLQLYNAKKKYKTEDNIINGLYNNGVYL